MIPHDTTTVAQRRLLVVDDDAALRAELQDLLAGHPDLRVVAAAGTPEAALSIVEHNRIDVAIVDYHLGSRAGLRLTRKLKRSARPPAVLIYGASSDLWLSAAAVVAQADALLPGLPPARLCNTVRSLARGERLLPPLPPVLSRALGGHIDVEQQLIFGMLLADIELAEIARTLAISPAALEAQLSAMLRTLEMLHTERTVPGMSHAVLTLA